MLPARLRSLARSLRRRSHMENEMTDELRFHLEMRAEELAARRGISPEEAMRQARLEFGAVERYKEEGREARGLRLLDEFRSDMRYSLRQFMNNRAFSASVVLILAIGIGGTVAVFSQINDALFKMLPVAEPDQLRQLGWTSPAPGFRTSGNSVNSPENVDTSFSYPGYVYLRDRVTSFSDLFCLSFTSSLNVGLQGRAEAATGIHVSGNYFRALGVDAAAGRTFTPAEDVPGDASAVAVLSHAFWQRAFNADPGVIGSRIFVNAIAVTVIGVTPRGFHSIDSRWRPDLMMPMALQSSFSSARDLRNAGDWTYLVYGRLRPEAREEQARAESETLLRQAIVASEPAAAYEPPRTALIAAGRGFARPAELPRHRMLAAVVAFVLLTACANVAGLLLARGATRRREIGTRLALGAPRLRIVRQLLMECFLLSLFAGALGIAVVLALPDLAPSPDLRVLLFSATVTVLTGILFGLAPAVTGTRVELFSLLKQRDRQSPSRSARFRSGKILVATQVALSFLLLVGAILFTRTLSNLRSQNLGINPENLITFQVDPFLNGYRDDRLRRFYEEAIKRVESVPGVSSAAVSRWGVLSYASSGEPVCIPGLDKVSTGAATHNVTPRYFETMGIPLKVGRDIEWSDTLNAPRVAVVNQAFSTRYYGTRNPVGESFRMDCRGRPGREVRIVGVVADAKYALIRPSAPATVYLPYMQGNERVMTFAVRGVNDPGAVLPAIRRAIAELDPNVPVHQVRTQRENIDFNVEQERTLARLLVFCSGITLLLCCLGIYGTLTYLVNRRIPEIGIRVALGARRFDVIRLFVLESLSPVVAGLAIGLAASSLLSRLIENMLFEISPRDPAVLAGATAFLAVTAALAAFLPARSASRIDPMRALRLD